MIPLVGTAPWFQWITYTNPISYAYESIAINEFSGRSFPCANLVPSGSSYIGTDTHNRVCSIVGSIARFEEVLGNIYIELVFGFQPIHLWRYVISLYDMYIQS